MRALRFTASGLNYVPRSATFNKWAIVIGSFLTFKDKI